MKKAIIILISVICAGLLSSCAGKNDDILHMGLNAVVTEIDTENMKLTVSDSGKSGIFGENCGIDCSEAYIIYCDYDTHEIVDISLEDLKEDDEIILSIYESELSQLEKGKRSIKADQVQLGTQRLEKEEQ